MPTTLNRWITQMDGLNLLRITTIVATMLIGAGCAEPKDTRPGLKLAGEAAAYPSDWSFADAHKEIAVEVATPYLLSHSVTIWCTVVDGQLHIAASAPETKNWPGWVDEDPDVRLKIGGEVYDVRVAPIDDPAQIGRIQDAYAKKYDLAGAGLAEGPPVRYWQVTPRA